MSTSNDWAASSLREAAGLPPRSGLHAAPIDDYEAAADRIAYLAPETILALARDRVATGCAPGVSIALGVLQEAGLGLINDFEERQVRRSSGMRGVVTEVAIGVAANVVFAAGRAAWKAALSTLRERESRRGDAAARLTDQSDIQPASDPELHE